MPLLLFVNTQKEIHPNNVENILKPQNSKPRRLLSVLVVVMSDWGDIKKYRPLLLPTESVSPGWGSDVYF